MSSKVYFILAPLYFLLALMWIFWIQSPIVGILWLCAAALNLCAALIHGKREKQGK